MPIEMAMQKPDLDQKVPMTIKSHELIEQVRDELPIPRRADTPEAMYSFQFVDEVELEVSVPI
jgi:hypothetical protein